MSNTSTAARGRWFYVAVTLFVIAFNILSFGPSLMQPTGRRVPLPLTALVVTHAIVAAAWLLVFLAQATLVATGRTSLHRRLGVAGVVLAIALVTTGSMMLIEEARRGHDLSGDLVPGGTEVDAAALLAVLNAFVLFGILVAAGLWYRHRRPEVHKRLMLLAVMGPLVGAPLAHLIGHWPALTAMAGLLTPVLTLAFLAAQPLHDRLIRGRMHPVSLWGGVLVFAWFFVFFVVIAPTAAWGQFAEWLVR